MTKSAPTSKVTAYARSGAAAGLASVFAFTVVHHLLISNIWSMFVIMLVAGAICGWSVGWSYALLVEAPSISSWLRYNLLYDALFLSMGAVSVIVFEPVTSMAALVAMNAPPDDLIRQAMPMTILFTLLAAVLISLLYKGSRAQFGAVLLTCVLLVLLLGLNVSTIGLVAIPRGSFYLLAEFFGLIFLINAVYAAAFIALEWTSLVRPANVNQRLPA